MKKSIFKKLMSFVATVAILATSTVVAMADYECASQSTDCSVDTWKYSKSADLPGTSMGITADGMLKVERSIFKTSTSECASYGLTAVTEGENKNVNGSEMWFKASEDGTKWESIPNPPNWGSTPNQYADWSFADDASFSKGTVQAKFDFKFEGDSRQCISVGFLGSTSVSSRVVGMRIYREQVRFWLPTDLTSNPVYYNQAKTNLPLDTWYTVTMSYNMDTKLMTYTMESRDDESFSISLTHSYDVANYWSSDVSPAAIKGIRFADYRGINNPVLSTTPDPANVVWYIDNVELDAGVGYKAENRYSTGDGMISNAPGAGMDFDGIKLDRLTRIADPANAKFITAAYANEVDDATGIRMEDVIATPLSAVGTTPIHGAVAGDVVKSFIMGMNNANPYMPVYTYADPATTVRKYDFEDGYTAQGAGNGLSITKVAEGDNNVIKMERTGFGSSYHMTYTENGWENLYSTKNSPEARWVTLNFDKTVNSYEASFKLKFAGFNNPSGYQSCQFNLHTKDAPALIQRKSDGKVSVTTDYDGGKSDMFVLGENEWCEVTIKVALGDKTTGTKVDWTFKKDGVVVATYSQTVDRQDLSAGTNKVYIGSRKDNDTMGIGSSLSGTKEATGYNTTSSVWYIDDFVVKY